MEYMTCLNGHRYVRSDWRVSADDSECLLCPKCGDMQDDGKPIDFGLRAHDRDLEADIRSAPPGRRAAHVISLITKLDVWAKSRARAGYDAKPLVQAVAMLGEYRDVLAANDIDVAVGAQLDRLLDPLPRSPGETDEDYRKRGQVQLVVEYVERNKPPPTLAPGKGAIVWRP